MPKTLTQLDPGFAPLSLAYRQFCEDVRKEKDSQRFVVRVVRGRRAAPSLKPACLKMAWRMSATSPSWTGW